MTIRKKANQIVVYLLFSILAFSIGYMGMLMYMAGMVMIIEYIGFEATKDFIIIFMISVMTVYLIAYFVTLLVLERVYRDVKKTIMKQKMKREVIKENKPYKFHWWPVPCFKCRNLSFLTSDKRGKYHGCCRDCIILYELGSDYLDE
jgi:hypothetical protein